MLSRHEFEAAFGSGSTLSVPAALDAPADPVALAAARSHIGAAIKMGREVSCCVVQPAQHASASAAMPCSSYSLLSLLVPIVRCLARRTAC
jgi:hypothetical protein